MMLFELLGWGMRPDQQLTSNAIKAKQRLIELIFQSEDPETAFNEIYCASFAIFDWPAAAVHVH